MYSTRSSDQRTQSVPVREARAGFLYVDWIESRLRTLYNDGKLYKRASQSEVEHEWADLKDKSTGRPWSYKWQRKGDVPIAVLQKSAEGLRRIYKVLGVVAVILLVFFKDEVTKKEKYDQHLERCIVGVPMDLAWLSMEAGLDFHEVTLRSYNDGPYVVGINPFSVEWDHLYRRHSRMKYHFEFDIKNCEKLIRAWWHREWGNLRKNHSEPDLHADIDLITEANCSKLLVNFDGTLEFCPNLNPSGIYDTTMITTRFTAWLVGSCLSSLGVDYTQFQDVQDSSIFGDNALQSYDDELYNMGWSLEYFTEYAARMGVDVKGKAGDLDEMTLLSTRFVHYYGRVLPATDHVDKLVFSAHYTKREKGVMLPDHVHAQKLTSLCWLMAFNHPHEWLRLQTVVKQFTQWCDGLYPMSPRWLLDLKCVAFDQAATRRKLACLQSAPNTRGKSDKMPRKNAKKKAAALKRAMAAKASGAMNLRKPTIAQIIQAEQRRPRGRRRKTARARNQLSLQVSSRMHGHRAVTNMPVGPPSTALTFVSGRMPTSYIRVKAFPKHNDFKSPHRSAKRVDFCVAAFRYGNSGSSSGGAPGNAAGGAALTYGGGATTSFAQGFVLGAPGSTMSFVGASSDPEAKNVVYTWLNASLATECNTYQRYRYNRLRFVFVPSTATTASARSYWAAWTPDAGQATTLGTSGDSTSISYTNTPSLPNNTLFPAWEIGSVNCDFDKEWRYVQRPTSSDPGSFFAEYNASYWREQSPGILYGICDYANTSGSPLLDGIVFAIGQADLIDAGLVFNAPNSDPSFSGDIDCHPALINKRLQLLSRKFDVRKLMATAKSGATSIETVFRRLSEFYHAVRFGPTVGDSLAPQMQGFVNTIQNVHGKPAFSFINHSVDRNEQHMYKFIGPDPGGYEINVAGGVFPNYPQSSPSYIMELDGVTESAGHFLGAFPDAANQHWARVKNFGPDTWKFGVYAGSDYMPASGSTRVAFDAMTNPQFASSTTVFPTHDLGRNPQGVSRGVSLFGASYQVDTSEDPDYIVPTRNVYPDGLVGIAAEPLNADTGPPFVTGSAPQVVWENDPPETKSGSEVVVDQAPALQQPARSSPKPPANKSWFGDVASWLLPARPRIQSRVLNPDAPPGEQVRYTKAPLPATQKPTPEMSTEGSQPVPIPVQEEKRV